MIKSANGVNESKPNTEAEMNPRLIVIDGKTYNSVNEMPPEVRRQYEEAMRNVSRDRMNAPTSGQVGGMTDANMNGLPDALEDLANSQGSFNTAMNSASIVVNGQTYTSIDQLPPEARAQYEQAMGALDANRNGIPDFLEGFINVPAQAGARPSVDADIAAPEHLQSRAHAQHKPKYASQTIEPESSGNWLMLLAGFVFLGVCFIASAAGVWYFFFR
jgi:hypothetical protein